MERTRVIALTTPRHHCHACGNCCFGHRISLYDADEAALVEAHGRALGIAEPVVDGALRSVNGHCVFLGQDRLCTIHARFGAEAKPRVCQQYPLRVSRAEDGLRVGVDPSCTSVWKSWRDGPTVDVASSLEPHDIALHGPPDPSERALLGMAQNPDMTVAGLLTIIAGRQASLDPSGDPLPPGFAGRLIQRLKALNIPRFIEDEAFGEGIRQPLAHVAACVETLDHTAPPAWRARLGPEEDAFALEVLRRALFMRLGDAELPVVGRALVLLSGAIACAWADPSPERFGPALSTWSRAARSRAFWKGFLPRNETVAWLAMGR